MKSKIVLIVVWFLCILWLLEDTPRVVADSIIDCQEYTFQVQLAPDDPQIYHVAGTLCFQGSLEGKTIQLLVAGGTYSHAYWDFPFQPTHYSYVRKAAMRGYATLNIDRIGIGSSDHPDGFQLNVQKNAYVVHQIVQSLRQGEVGDVIFEKVVIVAHSLGAYIAIDLAAHYPGDVDGVVLTGYLHSYNPDTLGIALGAFYPATFDPKFAGQFPEFDYFTTVPGTREMLFYYTPTTNPQVVLVDELLKETLAFGEFETFGLIYDTTSLQIDVPVFLFIGEFDFLVCGGDVNCSNASQVYTYESAFFSPAACLQTRVARSAGHSLNLHTNSRAHYAHIIHWIDQYIGANPGSVPGCP